MNVQCLGSAAAVSTQCISSHQQQRYDLTMGSCPHSAHYAANNIMNTSDGGNQRNPSHCRTHLCCNHFFANWLEGRLWSHDMISDLLVIDILISSFQQFINWGEGWTPLNNSWKLAAATSCQLEGVLFLEENKLSDIQQTPADVDLCCHKTSHLTSHLLISVSLEIGAIARHRPPNCGVGVAWFFNKLICHQDAEFGSGNLICSFTFRLGWLSFSSPWSLQFEKLADTFVRIDFTLSCWISR